jgi:hypothetical protein
MNILLEKCYEARKGHYCHALEVNAVYDLKLAIESLYEQEMYWLEEEFPSLEDTFPDEVARVDLELVEDEFGDEYNERKDKFVRETIIDFFETIELHCLNDEHEQEVFDFDIREFVEGL